MNFIFNFLRKVESYSAYLQGKGYGSATIRQEISCAVGFLGMTPTLAIDIGGNIGDYSAKLRSIYPALKIHIFEPSSVNLKKLMTRYAKDPLITVVPNALSSEAGSATLFSDQLGSGLASLANRNLEHFNIKFDASEIVTSIKFENYWKETLNCSPIDIVKIDVEGFELKVLEGFGSALSKVKIIQFEFGGANIDTRSYFRDFWSLFTANNFLIYRVTPLGSEKISTYRESDEFFSTTNYLAVNKFF